MIRLPIGKCGVINGIRGRVGRKSINRGCSTDKVPRRPGQSMQRPRTALIARPSIGNGCQHIFVCLCCLLGVVHDGTYIEHTVYVVYIKATMPTNDQQKQYPAHIQTAYHSERPTDTFYGLPRLAAACFCLHSGTPTTRDRWPRDVDVCRGGGSRDESFFPKAASVDRATRFPVLERAASKRTVQRSTSLTAH